MHRMTMRSYKSRHPPYLFMLGFFWLLLTDLAYFSESFPMNFKTKPAPTAFFLHLAIICGKIPGVGKASQLHFFNFVLSS